MGAGWVDTEKPLPLFPHAAPAPRPARPPWITWRGALRPSRPRCRARRATPRSRRCGKRGSLLLGLPGPARREGLRWGPDTDSGSVHRVPAAAVRGAGPPGPAVGARQDGDHVHALPGALQRPDAPAPPLPGLRLCEYCMRPRRSWQHWARAPSCAVADSSPCKGLGTGGPGRWPHTCSTAVGTEVAF